MRLRCQTKTKMKMRRRNHPKMSLLVLLQHVPSQELPDQWEAIPTQSITMIAAPKTSSWSHHRKSGVVAGLARMEVVVASLFLQRLSQPESPAETLAFART
jgi:hypothetical protein